MRTRFMNGHIYTSDPANPWADSRLIDRTDLPVFGSVITGVAPTLT